MNGPKPWCQFARLVVALCLCCTLAGCGSETPSRSRDKAEPEAESDRKPVASQATEVCVVATQHFITDMPDGFTPGHLRALLTKIAPDVVGTEAPTNVAAPWNFAPLELARVTKPWAEKNGIGVVPVGWNEAEYMTQLSVMFQSFQQQGKVADYQQMEQEFQTQMAAQPATCAFMNSEVCHGLWRKYHATLHDLNRADTPWEVWNAKILTNVRKLCREHPGERIAIVIGGAHGYYLQDNLASDKDVKLISAEDFFPFTDEDISAQTTTKDYLLALRLLNFPTVAPNQLGRLERLLKRIEEIPELQGDHQLFRGKLLMHQGQLDAALSQFTTLARADGQPISAFDGETRLREAAAVYAAMTKIRQEDMAGARSDLTAFMNDPGVTPANRQWAQQVMASIPE